MSYKVRLNTGETITIPAAVRATKDGSGTYLYDAQNAQVGSFSDGLVDYAIPADSVIEWPGEPTP